MKTTRRTLAFVIAGTLLAGFGGCIDGTVINGFFQDESRELPGAADNLVLLTVNGAPSGVELSVYGGDGSALDGIDVTSGDDGVYTLRFAGNSEFSGLRIQATWSGGQAFGIIPQVNKQLSVLCPERVVTCLTDDETACAYEFSKVSAECRGAASPVVMPALSTKSTAFSLILLGKVLSEGKSLGSLSCVLEDQMSELQAKYTAKNQAITTFVDLVETYLAKAGTNGLYPFSQSVPAGSQVIDLIDMNYLEAFADDFPDAGICDAGEDGETVDPVALACGFQADLLAAAVEVKVVPSFVEERIKVVFQADMRAGTRDGNCRAADPFKWASDIDGKTVFLTGGIHETTPVCNADVAEPYCITQETMDSANAVLGNWVPNMVPMYDDGTHGDATKGDGIHTFVAELPRILLTDSPHGKGVRIGYKYTYGYPGQGWTDAEEWPGNQRLLEVVDVNGDGLVVRRDVFGDEATNKDKANQLLPSNGGCGGVNLWESDPAPVCATWLHDTRERAVDLDFDDACEIDGWPQAGSVAPLTLGCM